MASQGEKRSHSDSADVLEGVKVALFDLEGTISPTTFAGNKLYPYVRENLKTYLENHWDNEECQADVVALRKKVSEDKDAKDPIPECEEGNRDDVIKAVVANVIAQMDSDSTCPSLRSLQGHMYREAYKTGKVQGQIYDDVVPALKKFNADGVKVYTFATSSPESQKLHFGYSDKGDLSEHFSGYYDTETGSKTAKESYTKIATEVGVEASEIMLFTILPAGAAAASEASLKTTLVEREGNALSEENKKEYNTVSSFSELLGDAPPAKKTEGEEGNGAVDEEADSAEAEEDDVDDEEVDDEEVDGDDGVDNGDS